MKRAFLLAILLGGCTINNNHPDKEGPVAGAGGSSAPVAGSGGDVGGSISAGTGGNSAGVGGSTIVGGSGGQFEEGGSGGIISPPQGGTGGIISPPQGGTGGSPIIIVPQGGTGGTFGCSEGYRVVNGDTCEDVNECDTNNGGCGSRACFNTDGAWTCGSEQATWQDIISDPTLVSLTSVVQTQSFTVRSTLRNDSDNDYIAPRVIVTAVEPGTPQLTGARIDFLVRDTLRIPARSGVTLQTDFDFPTTRPTGAWQLYTTHQDSAGAWHDGDTQLVNVEALMLTPTLSNLSNPAGYISAGPGEAVQATLTINNPYSFPVQVLAAVAGRRPGSSHSGGPFNDMTPQINTTLQPNAQVSQTVSLVIQNSFPAGQWEFYPTWQSKSGPFTDGPSQYFEVRPALDQDWGTFEPFLAGEVTFSCYPNFSASEVRCVEYYLDPSMYPPSYMPTGCDGSETQIPARPCPTNHMLLGQFFDGRQSTIFQETVQYVYYQNVAEGQSIFEGTLKFNPYFYPHTPYLGR